MPTRSELIQKAASLPIGNLERQTILSKLAMQKYHLDPNVSLESRIYNTKVLFVEDVAKSILRYSSLKTPVEGKSGDTFMRGSVAHGGLVNRHAGGQWALGVEVKVRGSNIIVELSSDEFGSKSWKYPDDFTPASIGSDVSWVGKAYLMGQKPR